jgi:hypothetical protein
MGIPGTSLRSTSGGWQIRTAKLEVDAVLGKEPINQAAADLAGNGRRVLLLMAWCAGLLLCQEGVASQASEGMSISGNVNSLQDRAPGLVATPALETRPCAFDGESFDRCQSVTVFGRSGSLDLTWEPVEVLKTEQTDLVRLGAGWRYTSATQNERFMEAQGQLRRQSQSPAALPRNSEEVSPPPSTSQTVSAMNSRQQHRQERRHNRVPVVTRRRPRLSSSQTDLREADPAVPADASGNAHQPNDAGGLAAPPRRPESQDQDDTTSAQTGAMTGSPPVAEPTPGLRPLGPTLLDHGRGDPEAESQPQASAPAYSSGLRTPIVAP